MRRLGIARLSACIALCTRVAFASDVPSQRAVGVRLDVSRQPGTEQCLTTHALEQAVEARLQRPIFVSDSSAQLVIRLRLALRDKRQWNADLRLEDGAGVNLGERTLAARAEHCSALDDSLALIVALLVDAPLSAREQKLLAATPPGLESGAETATPVLPSSTKPTLIELPTSTLAPRQPWRWEASVGVSLGLGLLPGTALGFELGVSGKAPRAPELRLFGGAYAPREAHAGPDDAGARFAALFVGLEVCPLDGQLSNLRWSACAGQSVAWLHAAAFGYDQNSSTDRLIYSLLARAALGLPLSGPVSARLSARAELPLARPVFVYGTGRNDEGSVFEMNPLLVVFEAGLSVAL
jgi:hypothetical protein